MARNIYSSPSRLLLLRLPRAQSESATGKGKGKGKSFFPRSFNSRFTLLTPRPARRHQSERPCRPKPCREPQPPTVEEDDQQANKSTSCPLETCRDSKRLLNLQPSSPFPMPQRAVLVGPRRRAQAAGWFAAGKSQDQDRRPLVSSTRLTTEERVCTGGGGPL